MYIYKKDLILLSNLLVKKALEGPLEDVGIVASFGKTCLDK